ncbi:MAG: AMP-binding protein [SAR324 cluster bacterium]|nr:AMP-binding protein [SAR324 cluster bacterium]MCZ6729623.1 AMP-binding protein [SAR324 cluster bacterium]
MTVQAFGVYDMLQRSAIAYGGRPAIIFEGGSSTFREFLARVDALATGLAGHALGKGERVCILAQNHPAYLELYGACAKLGLLAYPINWRLTAQEIERIVERAAPRMMVVDEASLNLVADWPESKKSIPFWYQIGSTPGEGFTPLDNLYIGAGQGEAPRVEDGDPFLVISTAAVDIIPRGAVLTHGNIMASNLQSIAALGLDERDCNLLALPLFHIAALGNALAVMHAGGANVLLTRFDPAEAVKLIDAHNVTLVSSFPPVLAGLLDAAQQAGSKLASLKHVSGLEGPEVIGRLESETSARFWIGFGQSETSGFVTLQPASQKPGAAGRPAHLSQIKLVDGEGGEVPVGTEGEILVRGPVVMREYFAQPDVTEQTFRGGWHHTGDLGRFDEEGYLFYAGRKPEKELIKPGGENVYPAEVETVIMEMEAVSGVCVFGVPDEQWGEAIKAVVEAQGPSEQEVIDHVGSRIARYKRPKWVTFTEQLPRTADGEVDRPAVKKKWGEAG